MGMSYQLGSRGLGGFLGLFSCWFGFFFRGWGIVWFFLNDVLEFEWANILLLLRDLNVTVRLL